MAPDFAVRVGWVLRPALLVLVGLLMLATINPAVALTWVGLLALATLPAWTPPRHPVLVPVGRLAEVTITAIGATELAADHGPSTASAILPYLTAPVIIAALEGRLRESMLLLGVATGALVVLGATDGLLRDFLYVLSAVEWIVIAGLSAGFVHTVHPGPATREPLPQPYAEATRLLTQLRAVARSLPGATLDPGGIAEHLIDEVRAIAAADRSAVLSGSGGGRLVVLAQAGAERVDWETALDSDSAIADAWASQQPQVSSRSQSRTTVGATDVSTLVVPLTAGVRTIALIVLEADQAGAYPAYLVSKINMLAAPAALRLEAALLFDDVRSLATNEERQRLAREIHDGVAQELVMVGYGIDNALATLPDPAGEAADELRSLRAEVTRVITELRLSLFELRSEVDRGGLTAAIAEYARTVGSSAGLRVHLSIDESTARLPAAIEAELLRIAQEAITNARKHAGAQNLWVTCEVDPPYVRIEVSDDGAGISSQRSDGRYGLAIMKERAERIRGRLEITARDSGGTTVAVVLGASMRRGVSRHNAAIRPPGDGTIRGEHRA
jgi:signal transduction histidine kinase